MEQLPGKLHPMGELEKEDFLEDLNEWTVDMHGGRIYVEWDPQVCVTPIRIL